MDKAPETERQRLSRFPISRNCPAIMARFVEEAGKGDRRLSQAARGAPGQSGLRRRGRRGRQDARPRRRIVDGRSAEGHRGAESPRHPVPRPVGLDPEARPGRGRRSGRRTGAEGQRASRTPNGPNNPVFDFLKQAYLITSPLGRGRGRRRRHGIDDHTRTRRASTCKQISSALSPSNFLPTNPELIRETFKRERRQSRARHAPCWRRISRRATASCGSARPIRATSRSA